jgi:peptidoglycan/LPS O-acetylase OafA/YrhL
VISWPFLTVRRLIVVSLLSGGAVAVAIVHKGNIDQGWIAAEFAAGLARTVFGFAVGVLIARHLPRAYRGVSNLKVLAIVAIVAIAIIGWPRGEWRAIWDAACVLVVFPVVVFCGTLIDPGPRLRRIATFLGLTSYAVYVLHSPLTSVLNSASRHLAGATGGGSGAPYLGIAVMVFLLAGCWLVDRFVDMPVRRYLSRAVPRVRSPHE